MNDLLKQLSSYNLFNNLLPGVLFAMGAESCTSYSFVHSDNLLVDAFVYYFIGMVLSRFGSLVVEPVLRHHSFIGFADYSDFLTAAGKDPKIETLSEANNTYRTLLAGLLLLGALYVWEQTTILVPLLAGYSGLLLLIGLSATFFFAYCKQTLLLPLTLVVANLLPFGVA